MPLTNVTRGSITGVAGLPDTPLKLVTIKSTTARQCQQVILEVMKI